jgi:uncharacterized protein YacL
MSLDIPLWWIVLYVVFVAGIVVIPSTLLALHRIAKVRDLTVATASLAGLLVGAISLGVASFAFILFMFATGSWSAMKAADVTYPTALGAMYGLLVGLIWKAFKRNDRLH